MTKHHDNKRPKLIADIASYSDNWELFSNALRNFLDEFYLSKDKSKKLEKEPELTGNDVMDAYLAATAEGLSTRFNIDRPAWASKPCRFLKRGWYPSGIGRRMVAMLLFESPIWFRRRGLFVSKDALDRASMPEDKRTVLATYNPNPH